MIAIIGANGSMGKRYQAILKFLDVPFLCFDVDKPHEEILKMCVRCKGGVILCTPTDTHAKFLHDLITLKVDKILCEKPITKDLNDLEDIYARAKEADITLTMVMQYSCPLLIGRHNVGDTYYDYFRHGNDGLYWDCFQIIALAEGAIDLQESSPVWKCMINGKVLSIANMDKAYVWFIDMWLKGKIKQDPKDIIIMHQKVDILARGASAANQSINRHSS